MEIPASLRLWFLAQVVVDLLIGLPLLIAPAPALTLIGWTSIDTASARLVGAALLTMAVQSWGTRHGNVQAWRANLNFKMIWSWIASGALLWAAADGAPDAVWAYMAAFIGFSGVWFHYRVRLGQFEEADDDDADEAVEKAKLLTDGKGEAAAPTPPAADREGDAQRVNARTSFAELGAEDIAAFNAERERKQAEAKAAAEEKAAAERAAAEAAAWEAADAAAGGEAVAPLGSWADAPVSSRTIQGFPTAPKPKEDEAAADEIAAMLAAAQDGDDKPEDAAGDDDIAAMLAAANGSEGQSSETPADDSAGTDDIAAMLAQSRDDEPDEARNPNAAEDIAALLKAERDRQSAAGESPEMASPEDAAEAIALAEMGATDPGLDVELGEGEGAAASPDTLTDLTAPSPDEVNSNDVVADEASAEEAMAADDIAAMLAGGRDDDKA